QQRLGGESLVELELVAVLAARELEAPTPVLESFGPARVLHDPVERDELGYDDSSHRGPPPVVPGCCPVALYQTQPWLETCRRSGNAAISTPPWRPDARSTSRSGDAAGRRGNRWTRWPRQPRRSARW